VEILFFIKKIIIETDISQGHVLKGLEGCLLHSTDGVYRDPLCPTPSTSSALKIPEYVEEDLEDLRKEFHSVVLSYDRSMASSKVSRSCSDGILHLLAV